MTSFKKLLTASSALAIAAVGLNAPASQAVVRGKNADNPAVVKIWLQGEHDGTKICTGTHVGNGWVLTAAHCGMHMHHKTLRVGWGDPRTGAYNPERGQTSADARIYGVEGTADRAEYPDDYRVDMMLIHSPELETAQVPAMPIRTEGTAQQLVAKTCTAYGYGDQTPVRQKPRKVGERLKSVSVRMTSAETDGATIDSTALGNLHGRGLNGSLSSGDSGGPVVCDGVLSGVISSIDNASGQLNFASLDAEEAAWIQNTANI